MLVKERWTRHQARRSRLRSNGHRCGKAFRGAVMTTDGKVGTLKPPYNLYPPLYPPPPHHIPSTPHRSRFYVATSLVQCATLECPVWVNVLIKNFRPNKFGAVAQGRQWGPFRSFFMVSPGLLSSLIKILLLLDGRRYSGTPLSGRLALLFRIGTLALNDTCERPSAAATLPGPGNVMNACI